MLTFEKIRELERMERESKKLQKLPEDVMDSLRDYLRRKERLTEKTSMDIMELENIKNTLKRFFEMREHKLLLSVLDTVRTGMPPENMTKEEEKVFYSLVSSVKQFREQFFSELQKEPVHKEQLCRVKKSLPEFIGPDMRTYKLNENDIVTLPKELEELLLKEGVIEKVD
jgi:DNA replication initiation complex subunit (GINS family)